MLMVVAMQARPRRASFDTDILYNVQAGFP
jgi:hypothetical protein